MSNICPQKPKLNRHVWEQLESTEIRDYAVRFEEIWVIDGPLFDDQPEKLPAGVDRHDAKAADLTIMRWRDALLCGAGGRAWGGADAR
jgi:hypothetical protein